MHKTVDQYQTGCASATGINIGGAAPAAITGATNASPIVITSAAHGLAYSSRLTGEYGYKVTFVDGSGETLPSPVFRAITLQNRQGYLSGIPLGAAGTTSRKIYRCAANSLTGTYSLVGTISDNTTTDFVDAVPDSALGAAAPSVSTAVVANPTVGPEAMACPRARVVKPPQVIIESVGGNTAANGIWPANVISSSTFQLVGSVGNAAYTSGGTWRRIAEGTMFVELKADTQNVRWRDDGTAPTTTVGNLLQTTDPPYLFEGDARKLKFIQVAATAGLNVRCIQVV